MTTIDWIVLLAGIAAIAWVNWYFFAAGRRTAAIATVAARPDGLAGPPEITITVQGGYSPQVVRTKAGQPVRLVFDRKESSSCTEEVVFPDFGIRKFLPAFQQTVVEVTPPAPGRYAFMCGMSMIRGELVAEA